MKYKIENLKINILYNEIKFYYYSDNCKQIINIKIVELLFIYLFIYINLKYINTKIIVPGSLAFYNHYINNFMNLKIFHKKISRNNIPVFSICLPVYNMENYIKKSILSLINQSFGNLEIVIVNDFCNDTTEYLINKLQEVDNRIKIINHSKNLGVYKSRVDAILSSRGKFILLMDPDDMILNQKLLEKLYNYNLKYNLDMIEYTVICYIEHKHLLKFIEKYYHYHGFMKNIIYQPELSDIFFHYPNLANYSKVQCRVIWNKMIRREILLNSIEYTGKDYYNKFFITAEDTIINLISLHFAKNYSNINLPGYMYNIRKVSMTHGVSEFHKKILFCYNHLLYLKKLYIYIKDFNKDRNYLNYELLEINKILLRLNKLSKKYKNEIMQFYNEIIEDRYSSIQFKQYILNITSFLNNNNISKL